MTKLSEITDKLKHKYITKAMADQRKRTEKMSDENQAGMSAERLGNDKIADQHYSNNKKMDDKYTNRSKYINKAIDKLKENNIEEATADEYDDEISSVEKAKTVANKKQKALLNIRKRDLLNQKGIVTKKDKASIKADIQKDNAIDYAKNRSMKNRFNYNGKLIVVPESIEEEMAKEITQINVQAILEGKKFLPFEKSVQTRLEELASDEVSFIVESAYLNEIGFAPKYSALKSTTPDDGYGKNKFNKPAFTSSNPNMRINRRVGLDKDIYWDDDAEKGVEKQKIQLARFKRKANKVVKEENSVFVEEAPEKYQPKGWYVVHKESGDQISGPHESKAHAHENLKRDIPSHERHEYTVADHNNILKYGADRDDIKESSFDKDLDETKPIKVHGVKGAKSTPFSKKFRNMKHFNQWAEKDENSGNYDIHRIVNEELEVNETYVDDNTKEIEKKKLAGLNKYSNPKAMPSTAKTVKEDVEVIDEAARKKPEVDEIAAHELVLHADNDGRLYHSSHKPIIANLKKKYKAGKYDHEKAKTLWGYHADRAAQNYHKDMGMSGKWHESFNKPTRMKAAEMFADHHRDEIEGN
jgi:hypothetical protein